MHSTSKSDLPEIKCMLVYIRRRITKKNPPQFAHFSPPPQLPTFVEETNTCTCFRIVIVFLLYFFFLINATLHPRVS